MWKVLQKLRLKSGLRKQIMLSLIVCGVAVVAFCMGRRGGNSASRSHDPSVTGGLYDPDYHTASTTSDPNYATRAVAYIYKNLAITRAELGEYLIARFGMQRVEFLVNRRIVELECRRQGIVISDGEIERAFQEDLINFGGKTPLKESEFVNQILRRFNKTLYEWKEDVIRPKLMLTRLARPRVHVTDADLQKAFEAKYGDQVKCRMIVLAKGTPQNQMEEIWDKVRKSESDFLEAARNQFIPNLAANAGAVPPIHHHFAGPEVEKEAFSLKENEVSRLIRMPEPDGSTIILRCEKRLPPDTTKSLSNPQDRLALENEVFQIKLQQETTAIFEMLRKEATPYLLLTDESHRVIPPPVPAKELVVQPTSFEGRTMPPPLPKKKPN